MLLFLKYLSIIITSIIAVLGIFYEFKKPKKNKLKKSGKIVIILLVISTITTFITTYLEDKYQNEQLTEKLIHNQKVINNLKRNRLPINELKVNYKLRIKDKSNNLKKLSIKIDSIIFPYKYNYSFPNITNNNFELSEVNKFMEKHKLSSVSLSMDNKLSTITFGLKSEIFPDRSLDKTNYLELVYEPISYKIFKTPITKDSLLLLYQDNQNSIEAIKADLNFYTQGVIENDFSIEYYLNSKQFIKKAEHFVKGNDFSSSNKIVSVLDLVGSQLIISPACVGSKPNIIKMSKEIEGMELSTFYREIVLLEINFGFGKKITLFTTDFDIEIIDDCPFYLYKFPSNEMQLDSLLNKTRNYF